MAKPQLSRKIRAKLAKKLNLAETTVSQQISARRRKYPSCTLNAVAQIYAEEKGTTVMQHLSSEDRASLPNIETTKEKIIVKKTATRPKEQIKKLIEYDSSDPFVQGHINELNRAYTKGCYTAAYILLRKIIENLILDILQDKFPPESSIENKELYWDVKQNRFKDFSIILQNLFDKRSDFSPKNVKAIERLNELCKNFKNRANDKTHSWFHLLKGPRELNDLEPQIMIELIKTIEKYERKEIPI